MMKKSLKYTAILLIVICVGYLIYDYSSGGVLNEEPVLMLVIVIGSSLALFKKDNK